jgi:MFS family permease
MRGLCVNAFVVEMKGMKYQFVGERVLLTLWVGGLWAIGYIAVPTLFSLIEDKTVAGSLAGQMFHIMSYIGLVCGSLLLISVFVRNRLQWQVWLLILMLVLVASSEFIIQPMMETLKAQGLVEGSPTKKQFGILHGVASSLYLIVSLCGLSLVMFGLGGRKTLKEGIPVVGDSEN